MYARREFCGRASASARPDGTAIAAAPAPSLAGWAVRVVGAGSAVLNLHLDRAHPCHICTGAGLTPAKFAPGLGSVHPNRRQLGLLLAATSAPGQGSALPQLRLGWAHPARIFAGTGLAPAHICTRTDWAVGAARWRRCGGTARCGRTRASGCSSMCTAAIRPRARRAIVILPRRSRLPLLPAARHHRRDDQPKQSAATCLCARACVRASA